MLSFVLRVLPLLACVFAVVLGMDIMDELAGEWKMGLRPRQGTASLQPFGESLGGAPAAPITNSGDTQRPFDVSGDTFPDFFSAGERSCDNQKNACADIANGGSADIVVDDCDQQAIVDLNSSHWFGSGSERFLTNKMSHPIPGTHVNNGLRIVEVDGASVKTSPPTSPIAPGAPAQDGHGDSRSPLPSPPSPALSSASTADGGEDELGSSPALPPIPAPRLPDRALELLRTPPSGSRDEFQFGTASWGSPYPRADHNLRRQSFSSEASDESPIHHLAIDTPFLRPAPDLSQVDSEPQSAVSAAAAVLANRARRRTRGLTEDWIRTHTTADSNVEPRHWFSDGSGSEHSSLSGSEAGWLEGSEFQTPKALNVAGSASRRSSRHPRGRSSVETLKPEDSELINSGGNANMANDWADMAIAEAANDSSQTPATQEPVSVMGSPKKLPVTPTKLAQKPLPKEPAMTPRIKKKVPWKGKNIMVLVPRDDGRGLPNHAPLPLTQDEIDRMYTSWEELGYNISGFDLLVEGWRPQGTDDSQSRDSWPNWDDVIQERAERVFKVALPDKNAWDNYVNELQEAKLRALGVTSGEDEPDAQSTSPPTTQPSRQASAQYPPLPFSPPLPTSSASSNHGIPGFPFPAQFVPGLGSATQSPGIPSGASPGPFGAVPGKYNPRQSISFPASSSPFQSPGWHQSVLLGSNRSDSPSLANLNGILSPQSPYGFDNVQPSGSPAYNLHQRTQSLQFPLLPHQSFHQPARASPRLQEVREDEEEEVEKSPSKTPEPPKQNSADLQAEIDDAEYHLEESLRNQLEHEDYNPQTQSEQHVAANVPLPSHSREPSGAFPVPEHFANEPNKPLVLHHPRPHSRGHSLSQNFFRDHSETQGLSDNNTRNAFGPLKDIAEIQKGDESYEIETNPSNLGTPVQEFGFPQFKQHQKSMSTASNPWHDSTSVHSNDSRRSSHGSKPSFSKLNVKAKEFKFNPSSSFTPSMFSFSGNSPQPPAFQASFAAPAFLNPAPEPIVPEAPVPSILRVNAASFAPGQSDFSFSTSGPKFRPDAPTFTPSGLVTAPLATSGTNANETTANTTGSIFGKIEINEDDMAKPSKRSKAIAIIRPSSQSPSRSNKDTTEDELQDGPDGRLVDETRYKRARSSAPDGDDVPMFAERPENLPSFIGETQSSTVEENPEVVENSQALPIDTSISSLPASEQADTKATTAVTSETSQAEQSADSWVPFEFKSSNDVRAFNESRPFSDEMPNKRPAHKKSLSATAHAFVPGAVTYGGEEENSAEEDLLDQEQGPVSPVSPQSAHDEKLPSPSPPPQKRQSKGLGTSRFASPPLRPKGLAASRYADVSPPPEKPLSIEPSEKVIESVEQELDTQSGYMHESEVIMPSVEVPGDNHEPTFEEIDAILLQMENDQSNGVNKTIIDLQQQQPALNADAPPFQPGQTVLEQTSRDSASPTPRAYDIPQDAAPQYTLGTELEDPFIDPPISPANEEVDEYGEPLPDTPLSDWEGAFSEDEHEKLESRAQFFDGRVNEVVGSLLASRLDPLEKSLSSIQQALAIRMRRTPSSRRDMRSVSAELQESDADDEDEEPVLRRSMSPRRDRRMEQIRLAVTEALASQQRSLSIPAIQEEPAHTQAPLLQALQDMREHLDTSLRSDFRTESLRNIIEEAVQNRLPPPTQPVDDSTSRVDELQAKIADLEQRLYFEQNKMEKEITERRAAEDLAAELNRKLQAAETRVEVEIINRSVFDQRVTDLEEKLRNQEDKAEQEVQQRRSAEDRLSEAQRLLRISSEEETRLRDVLEEREQRIKALEQSSGKTAMRMTLLEATQTNATKNHTELTNKINVLETDLRNVRQDNHQWRAETERAEEAAHRSAGELAHVQQENKHLQQSLSTLTIQLEENERLRELWRAKFLSLQDDMSKAAREVAEENARRIKKEQTMLARQDVLDARLQAEAKTRERLEVEMERLQTNERDGMRAVNECKRLESLLGELRTENHKLEESALRYQREFQEARESGLSEVKRTRISLQLEIDAANNQVNIVREELEEQNAKLRAELDNVRLDADTAKAQNEMLLEEAQSNKVSELAKLEEKHQNELEDLQTRYERQVSNAVEDGQKSEQHLLERLSFSSSKIEHLQDRIVHLEDKLEIAKQAAAAAAQAAKSASAEVSSSIASPQAKSAAKLDGPERISPQALRESIMVLQEQLQAREQRIEELEQIVTKADPDAATKILKRDDEISWLRELLAVRHGDLQDIINALSGDTYDREAVKDAAIRLKANLQMEEQERERAVNGGSAINLPNIAQTIQAATPRIAQTVGPIAAAWGNWRKGNQSSFRSISGVLSSPVQSQTATPSRSSSNPPSSLLGGLMTPPASGLRQTPPADTKPQPTAFASTGRRYTSQGSAPSRVRGGSTASRRSENLSLQGTPPRRIERPEPMTPPMMVSNAYDSDAQPGDFDDHDFFDEED
ncbi:hypothetical protein HJFPF1_04863 [Paramyrothecium foliicola]|nr:hypothetical protein HJFPF1_04863 [Paramyrothecium foliicola]